MLNFSISPLAMLDSLVSNRTLAFQLANREVVGRYRGSSLGLLWSFFNPLFMLFIYTFVFSFVFNARWGVESGTKTEFALVLFSGLMVFNIFADCITKAPSLIVSNVNYVKKVVFPLEILPLVTFGSAIFHFLISLMVWLIAYIFLLGLPPITAIYFPIVLMPLLFFTMGVSWLLASLGVYVRDISQFIGIFTTALLFLSPIFYPLTALPEEYQVYMLYNPLTYVIEQTRDVLIWGKEINWSSWSCYMGASIVVSWLGFAWFQKTRKGFADVI
jgi:lipopolysaccharide transport system permease protein